MPFWPVLALLMKRNIPSFFHFFCPFLLKKKKSFVWMDLPVTVEVQHSKILMFPFSSSTDKNRYGSGHVQEADK